MHRLHRHLIAFLVALSVFALALVGGEARFAAWHPWWSGYLPAAYLAYGLACAAVMLLLEPTRRSLAAVLVVAVAVGYTVFRTAPSLVLTPAAGPPLAIAAVEAALLAALVLASFRLSRSVRSVGDVVGHLTATGSLAGADDPHGPRIDEDPRVRRELARSRRYHRPLSVVVIEPNEASLRSEWPRLERAAREAFVRRYLAGRVQRLIGRHLRFVDVLFEDATRGRFVLFCPEAQASDVEGLVRRIRGEAAAAEGVSLRAGCATFPEAALTLDALLEEAEAHLRAPAGPDVAAAPAARDPLPRVPAFERDRVH